MKFDSKVKGGLAWTGLFVILAVPAANLVFGDADGAKANIALTSDTRQVVPVVPATKPVVPVLKAPAVKTDPVETASIDTPAAKSGDPVDTFIAKGKKLPAYISDADTAPVAKPAVPVVSSQPTEVAAIAPVTETPPIPRPRDARPKATVVASTPAAAGEQPLIIDENELAQREATLTQPRPVEPFPLSDGGQDDQVVTGDQLEEWDSGSLADYLARKGLLSEGDQQNASDDSDFVFNEGPSRPRRPADSFFLF